MSDEEFQVVSIPVQRRFSLDAGRMGRNRHIVYGLAEGAGMLHFKHRPGMRDEELYEKGFIGHNVHVYEPSIHIPLIVRLPSGVGPSGVRIGGLVDLLDVAPTVADVFGVLGRAGSDASPHASSIPWPPSSCSAT